MGYLFHDISFVGGDGVRIQLYKLWIWGLVFLGLFIVTCGTDICYENYRPTDPDGGVSILFYNVFWGRSFRDESGGPVWL